MRQHPLFGSSRSTCRHLLLCLTIAFLSAYAVDAQLLKQYAPPGWPSAGQDLANTRNQFREGAISPQNVKNLKLKWIFSTGGNVSATPTVAGGVVYFPDSAGNLFAVDKRDGILRWSHTMAQYTGVPHATTRVSPAVNGDHLYVGDKLTGTGKRVGADLLSINRLTGALEWITQIETHPAATITGSPVIYNGVVYIGVSSNEEGYAENATYPCCTFRGSVVAVNATSGKLLWKTYTVPDNGGKPGGYSGGSIWSPPALDIQRGLLYVGTANNYTAPASVVACLQVDPTRKCTAPNDYFDSVLALDLHTGQIKWGTHLRSYDIWTLACIRPAAPRANCPLPSSPDSGSGSGPNLMANLVGIGQKDGTYWALNAETGKVQWTTQVGPGGSSGGVQWGTATDGQRIYVPLANSDAQPQKLVPSGDLITWGSWSALAPQTGKILWQVPDPTRGVGDPGAATSANGVLYVGSGSGHMYALDAATGQTLWQFNSGGEVIDGPAVVEGSLFWGSGYGTLGNDKLYAFSLN